MTATRTILAHWIEGHYITEEASGWDWRSEDGDNWVTGDGIPVECDEFDACQIHLVGGPRDNTFVS